MDGTECHGLGGRECHYAPCLYPVENFPLKAFHFPKHFSEIFVPHDVMFDQHRVHVNGFVSPSNARYLSNPQYR